MILDFSDDPRGPSGYEPPLHIAINGAIDAGLLDHVTHQLATFADAAELHLTIDSPGGNFAAAYDAFVLVRRHRAATKTAHIVRAESGALLVAMAADVRTAEASAAILLHQVVCSPEGRWTAALHRLAADDLDTTNDSVAALFSERTGRPKHVFAEVMKNENHSSIGWCITNNIIHELEGIHASIK